MRIGIEAQRIFRPKRHGMDVVAIALIQELQKLDQDNEYFIFVRPGESPSVWSTDRFQVVPLRAVTYADWEQVQLPRAVRRYGLDVLHFTSNTASLASPVPTVLTLHDVIFLEQGAGNASLYQKLGHRYRRWVVPKAVEQARQVVTVSHYEREQILRSLPEARHKLAVAYNGVDDAFFEAWPAEQQAHLRQSLGLPARYWLFHGNTAPKKNALGMLQAYARYRAQSQEAWPLVLTEIDAQALDPWLAATGLQALRPHLHPVGYVAHGQLPGLYQSAEGFLYPSLRESFGLPVVEAMAGGTPVIASNRSAIPEIAGEAALLVTPDTPDDIARAMLAVQHDGQKAGALRRLGPQRAQCFQWRYTAEEMLAQYRLAAGQAATLPTLY